MRFPVEVESAEPCAAPDRGRNTGFARHQVLAAAPPGELGRSALSSGPNPMPEHSAQLSRVLGELHRDLSYLMMGRGVSVAGADREEASGPKPEPLSGTGRRDFVDRDGVNGQRATGDIAGKRDALRHQRAARDRSHSAAQAHSPRA